jgi:hypothetical protein
MRSNWISVGLAAGRVIRRLQLSPGPSGAATRGAGPSPQAQGGAAGGGLDKSPDGEQHATAGGLGAVDARDVRHGKAVDDPGWHA